MLSGKVCTLIVVFSRSEKVWRIWKNICFQTIGALLCCLKAPVDSVDNCKNYFDILCRLRVPKKYTQKPFIAGQRWFLKPTLLYIFLRPSKLLNILNGKTRVQFYSRWCNEPTLDRWLKVSVPSMSVCLPNLRTPPILADLGQLICCCVSQSYHGQFSEVDQICTHCFSAPE